MLATVDSLLPLTLLEAVRDVDTPADQHETEFVDELRNKRLGLSDTVYTQIRRYSEAVRRRQRTPLGDSTALATLIGRRPDAEAVFREAGRLLARRVYQTVPALSRSMMRILPGFLARPMALRRARRAAARYFNGNLRKVGGFLMLEIPRPVTLGTAPGSIGCSYYEASLKELLHLLVGASGAVEHVHCSTRGEGHCEWRADWRSFDKGETA